MRAVSIESQMPFLVAEAVLPLRGEPAEAAEMVSQLLLGESGLILEVQEPWCRVRRDLDGYEGWVDAKMIEPVSALPAEYGSGAFVLSGCLYCEDGYAMSLPIGVRLPAHVSISQPNFQIGPRPFSISRDIQLTHPLTQASVVSTTELFFHTPYLWGGVSSFGIDCSGLVQTVFRMCGVSLPRDAYQQVACGQRISFGQHQAGDLAFFSKINQAKITHVGILGGPAHILHASGRVRQDSFSAQGIVHSSTSHLTHQLISIRRC